MDLELIGNVVDEDSFISLIFPNDLTKQKLFLSLKDFILYQGLYTGIKGYCAKNKIPAIQFTKFVDECVQKNVVKTEKLRYRFTDIFLEKAKDLSEEWARYYSKTRARA